MKFKRLTVLISTGLLAVTLASCGSSSTSAPTKIVATDNGWDSQKIHNSIAELVVEHAYEGYEFEVSTASSNMNWQAIIAGEVDLDIESWTDNVASYASDVKKGDIVDVGALVPDSKQGLYVPRYMVEGDAKRGIEATTPDLKTVKDLMKYSAAFPDDEDPTMGRIYGATPGYMADDILNKKYMAYGLDQKFTYTRLGSEAASFASLVAAYNLGDPWVGYCYEPTLITGQLDLILLEDTAYDADLFFDGKCAFPSQKLKIVSSNKFADKAPDLLKFFQKYQTGSMLISDALAHMDKKDTTPAEAAVWFLKENDKLLDQWLPKENAATLREYLSQQK